MIITDKEIEKLRTAKGGFKKRLVKYCQEITSSKSWKTSLNGKSVTEEQWNKMLKFSGTNKKNHLLNSISKPDGWAWKPPVPPAPKRESKGFKNQGKKARKREFLNSQPPQVFYSSKEWLSLRVRVLEKYDCKCMMCGRSPQKHGVVIHVDHIKPRSKYPELSLCFDNLQLLCDDCNIGKSNKYQTDWRPDGNQADFEILESLPVTMQ